MNRVNELIIGSGMSQKQVALEVGVSRPTVSDWANNKKDPRGENLHKLSKLFNVDWHEIIVTGTTTAIPPAPRPSSGLTDEDLAKIAEMVHKKHPSIGEAVPQTIEARILAAGVDKMPEADRERALQAMRFLFIDYADYFETKGTKNDDT